MNANDGGPAFPQHGWSSNPEVLERMKTQGGMTLRDWFAGQEQLSDCNDIDMGTFEALAGKRPDGNLTTNTIAWLEWEAAWRARIRYIRADAMLKAREEKL